MKRRQFNKLVTGLAAGVCLTALSSLSVQAAEPLKVGFVYVGPIGDHGWSYQHDQGRLSAEAVYGDKIKTTYVENVAEGADAQRVIYNLAKTGHDLIFTTSFGFMNPTLKVAKQFPKVAFEHATGYKMAKNVGTYISTTFEGRYVAGYVASQVTKSNKIGYIASFPIPEVIRDINAVQLALNKYNPDAELKVIWVNSWFDPGKEADAANAMMDQGVDVILQHTDSPAAMQAAERRGAYAVGQASDMSSFGPNAHLLSVVDEWGPHYINTIKAVMDGTWKPKANVEGMKEGAIVIPSFNESIPADVVAHAKELIAGIKDGSVYPFAGPIKNKAGELIVPEGTRLSYEDLEKMNWYVEGVQSDIPQ
ncbi:BMP family ABC transporter substrate-binding protein [Amphritea sp. 2_MG-2023]|jgi:simple sugar transport system substrate-binding protein|uniref:BMP family ABC transporter substrate-binding protein n=1 Tax=Amphritea TaxID=515417 RepID=UPI001C07E6D8|nr:MULTISPECIES: BMP family ABC transporter substrate-binding protein [Amphritea]MBU2964011.1 BMP family ABC transporter substrate-binding protein [Amphritea atlantica]MDO6420285.1 BMP family ABC transporter substrate-binding protein [Amphritea sp. 2_MG-2023]MDX2421438.1 BMP family ABC transporter substrate-binding protein [Amphritea sp.]